MADVAISELTNRQPTGSAVIPYSEGGVTYQSTATQLVSLASGVPSGVIVMWSGPITSIPSGWTLCNGANGTPDLRNQFIIGASIDVGGQSQTEVTGTTTKTGGTKDAIVVSHSHTASDAGHTHSYTGPLGTQRLGTGTAGTVYTPSGGTSGTGYASITVSTEGSSGTNQNLPPYYALAYIMKL